MRWNGYVDVAADFFDSWVAQWEFVYTCIIILPVCWRLKTADQLDVMGEKTSQNDVVRDPSVGTPILVPNVQIGDLVGANYYRKDSLRSDSVPPTNPAARPWIYNTRILNHYGQM